MKKLTGIYFSPTGGTKKILQTAAEAFATAFALPEENIEYINLTSPEARKREYVFGPDPVIIAIPTYAGRLPNKILPDLENCLRGGAYKKDGEGETTQPTPAIAISVLGNRSPDEAPRELTLLLEKNGFNVIALGVFVSRHAFSDKVGQGRPDAQDMGELKDFAKGAAEKIGIAQSTSVGQSTPAPANIPPIEIDRREIGPYYTPLKEDGSPAVFLKAKPEFNQDLCVQCGICVTVCPVGSIDADNFATTGICIKCQACIRLCPTGAKFFTDPDFLSHVKMLEENFRAPAANRVWL